MSTENRKKRIVMLPSEVPTKIILENGVLKFHLTKIDVGGNVEYMDLYILSDEEPIENDCGLLQPDNLIVKVPKGLYPKGSCVKIIVSTNTEIGSGSLEYNDKYIQAPRPSDKFIRKFIEEFNKGNIIKEVLVEYGTFYKDGYNNWFPYDKEFWDSKGNSPKFGTKQELKVAPDNTITIRPIELDDYTEMRKIGLTHDQCSEVCDYINKHYKKNKK